MTAVRHQSAGAYFRVDSAGGPEIRAANALPPCVPKLGYEGAPNWDPKKGFDEEFFASRMDGAELRDLRALGLNTDESRFLRRELRAAIVDMFMKELEPLSSLNLFPQIFVNDPGAEVIPYTQLERLGEAKIMVDYAAPAPAHDSVIAEFTAKVRPIRAAAKWNVGELRKARKTGWNVQGERSANAQESIERQQNVIAFRGADEYSILGLASDDNNIPVDPAGGKWTAITDPPTMLDALVDFTNKPTELTEIEQSDTLAVPTNVFHHLTKLRIADTQETVLSRFLMDSPYIRNVVRVPDLKDPYGTGGVDDQVAFCFPRDTSVLRFITVMNTIAWPPQRKEGEIWVNYEKLIAGLQVVRPLACRITRGV